MMPHARRHQLLDRIRAERVERVDLLGDAHRAELRRDPGSDAPGDHEAGQHRSQFPDHRTRDQASDVHGRAEGAELHGRLQREHHAGEEPREQHDAERLDADLVHLHHEVLPVERASEDEAKRLPGERDVILEDVDLVLGRLVEPCQDGGHAVTVRGRSICMSGPLRARAVPRLQAPAEAGYLPPPCLSRSLASDSPSSSPALAAAA